MRDALCAAFRIEPSEQARAPWVTAVAMALCVAAFGVVVMQAADSAGTRLLAVGWRPPSDVWRGQQWALVSSAFVHQEAWHIALNLYWIWRLAPTAEAELGPWRFAAFWLLAAFVSSAAELATGSVGIGASGVAFAIFGLLWSARGRVPSFAAAMPNGVVGLWLVWLLACVLLTRAGALPVANSAHFGGLAFGAAAGMAGAVRRRLPGRLAVVALCAAAGVVSVWCPWAHDWAAARAMIAHDAGDHAAAEAWYLRSRALGGDGPWVAHNLALLHLAEGRFDAAESDVAELRRLDAARAKSVESSSQWAGVQAFQAYVRRDFAGAERWYLLCSERGGPAAWSWDGVTRSRLASGNWAGAREAQSRLRELDPTMAAALDGDFPK